MKATRGTVVLLLYWTDVIGLVGAGGGIPKLSENGEQNSGILAPHTRCAILSMTLKKTISDMSRNIFLTQQQNYFQI